MSIYLNKITLQHDKYPTREYFPFSLQILNRTSHVCFRNPVTVFVGENGTGKSTLLGAIAQACGIHIWTMSEGVRYQVNKYEKILYQYLNPEWSDGSVPGAYFGSEIFARFKKGSKTANNVGDDWYIAVKQVAVPIDNKIYIVWGSEEKFTILLNIILKLK